MQIHFFRYIYIYEKKYVSLIKPKLWASLLLKFGMVYAKGWEICYDACPGSVLEEELGHGKGKQGLGKQSSTHKYREQRTIS